jgi:hypothetical protein
MGDELHRIRALCLSMPETIERPSHGAPTFFIRGTRSFVTFHDDHHGDGRLAIWAACAPEVQRALVEGDPERYFVPPYVGPRGWIGVRLDRGLSWDEVAGVVEDAWLLRAPKRLAQTTAASRTNVQDG